MKLFAILIRLIVSVAKLSVAQPLSSSSPPIMNTFVPCLCLASSASASEFVTTLTDSPSGSPRTICKPTGDAGRKTTSSGFISETAYLAIETISGRSSFTILSVSFLSGAESEIAPPCVRFSSPFSSSILRSLFALS